MASTVRVVFSDRQAGRQVVRSDQIIRLDSQAENEIKNRNKHLHLLKTKRQSVLHALPRPKG
jgi:hypothetical protein